MKVLDLQCSQQHEFEGWFGSEEDFQDQSERGLIKCPLCGDASVSKRLSAPHLNLGGVEGASENIPSVGALEPELQRAWMAMARRVLASTEDVGDNFAEEARKIHYGEAAERGIRGQASRAQMRALLDEGVSVLPLLLPESLRDKLQ